jgi:hypothetical protein
MPKQKTSLRKSYSAFSGGAKGTATQNTGTDVDPNPAPSAVPDLSAFHEKDFSSVPSAPKGESLHQKGPRAAGYSIEDVPPLAGHTFMDNNARGNQPKRGKGNPGNAGQLSPAEAD